MTANNLSSLFLFLITNTLYLGLTNTVYAQKTKHSTYYYQRASLFEELAISKNDIVFVGNSITDGGEWFELLDNKHVKNRGISGDTTQGVIDRLKPITEGKPKKIFLLIGTNDISRGRKLDDVLKQLTEIVKNIKKDSPRTQIYIQSILPMNPDLKMFSGHTKRYKEIAPLNEMIEAMTISEDVTYINLYSSFADEEGKLKLIYTNDGLHLMGTGYSNWARLIKPYL